MISSMIVGRIMESMMWPRISTTSLSGRSIIRRGALEQIAARTRDYGTSMSAFDAYRRAQTPAETLAQAEISAHGPIGFARFMEIALYGPAVGYYETRAAWDFNADYVTSPQLHPAFGVLLCGQVEEMWRRLGRPSVFWL